MLTTHVKNKLQTCVTYEISRVFQTESKAYVTVRENCNLRVFAIPIRRTQSSVMKYPL
jgi:hypothetical protein